MARELYSACEMGQSALGEGSLVELWDPEKHEFELAVASPPPRRALRRRRASRGFASASVAMSDAVMPKPSGSFPPPPPKPKVSHLASSTPIALHFDLGKIAPCRPHACGLVLYLCHSWHSLTAA